MPRTKNTPDSGKNSTVVRFTVPGLSTQTGKESADILQDRLFGLIDLSMTLKHIHWNVVGPAFIGVHTMLDPQVAGVLIMIDETAERIATLGQSPNGLAGNLVGSRTWDDYSLNRALVPEHLGALDLVYCGIIESSRDAMESLGDLDPVSEDMVTRHTALLEQYHWFVRAHLESAEGVLATEGAPTEQHAAAAARAAS